MKITIVIIEDQILLTEAYKSLLLNNSELEVIGQATDAVDAINLINKTKPDVALMDIHLKTGTGLEVTRSIQKTSPLTKVLVLSQHHDLSIVHKMMNAGAWGFITKTSNPEDLLQGIKTVVEGENYFCPKLKDDYSKFILDPKLHAQFNDYHFTYKEKEIIQLIASGKSPDEIAKELGRSKRTIEVHLGRVYKKIGINKVIHLAAWIKNNPWIYA